MGRPLLLFPLPSADAFVVKMMVCVLVSGFGFMGVWKHLSAARGQRHRVQRTVRVHLHSERRDIDMLTRLLCPLVAGVRSQPSHP